AQAARLGAIPFAVDRSTLRVAFIDPSNIAAIDEIAAMTGKRVAPAVTTEVRLMQALQKFYGRHMPGGFRTIAQKLDRKTAQTRRLAEARSEVDFRDPDVSSPPAAGRSIPVTSFADDSAASAPELSPLFPEVNPQSLDENRGTAAASA